MDRYLVEALFVRGDESYKRLFTNVISIVASFGVSVSPIIDSMALGIAKRLHSRVNGEGMDTEESLDSCIRFITDVDLARVTLQDYIPLRVDVELTAPMPPSAASIYVQFVLTIITRFTALCTGDPYCISSVENTGDGTYVANLSPSMEKCPRTYGNNFLGNMTITEDGEVQRAYMIDGNIKIVREEAWMNIIDALSTHPRDASSISKSTGIPRATVLLNIHRMMHEGIIMDVKREKATLYTVTTDHAFTWNGINLRNTADEETEMDLMTSDPDSFFLHMMSYTILKTDSLGIDIGPLLYKLSGNLADVTMDLKKYTSIKEALSSLQGSEFKTLHVVSFLPFSLVFVSPKKLNGKVARVASEFDVRYFSRLLERITGTKYIVSESEVYGEGNENHRLVFKPVV